MPVDLTRLGSVLGINQRNIDVIGRLNPRAAFPVVDNKVLTKRVMGAASVPVAKTIAVVETFTRIEATIELLKDHQVFVVKPARGRAGGGIMLLETRGIDHWETPSGTRINREALRKHFADILFGVYSFGRTDDAVLVEERIIPSLFFRSIYENGIADIRIITLKNNPIVAMARIPTDQSDGKANIHQGAIGVAVDINPGETTHAAASGKQIDKHPDTGHPLIGLTVPDWERIIEISVEASALVDLGYIGVDIVADAKTGPLVLELNARPGLQIQVVNGKGLIPLMQKVLA